MNTQNSLWVVVGALIIGLLIGYVAFGTDTFRSSDEHMMGDGHMMADDIDQHFITEMIPHHEGAIVMAKVALERSKRPEILSLAEGIIEAQEKENADMRAWYEAWFGGAPSIEVGSMVHMDGMEGDPEKLNTVSAAEFDREFIEQMIPHHEMAIMMAQMLEASTQRDEMKILANNIITSQSREIQMMRSWLESWY